MFTWRTHWKDGTGMYLFKRKHGDDRMMPVLVQPLDAASVNAAQERVARAMVEGQGSDWNQITPGSASMGIWMQMAKNALIALGFPKSSF